MFWTYQPTCKMSVLFLHTYFDLIVKPQPDSNLFEVRKGYFYTNLILKTKIDSWVVCFIVSIHSLINIVSYPYDQVVVLQSHDLVSFPVVDRDHR